jgi:glycerol-3-phosphate dehydrogenase subunit C
LEKLGWTAYSLDLLKRIPGLTVLPLESQCCGIAGTYGFKNENYKTAQEIGDSLFCQLKDSKAELVVSDCETCRMQITMSTGIESVHPITLLSRSISNIIP